VLAPLAGEPVPPTAGSVLALLRPSASPLPLLDRERELRKLRCWVGGSSSQCGVMVLGGLAGAGKSRLALDLARGVGATLVTGWLRPGAARDAYQVIQATGRPTLILADDADLRADLIPLLSQVLACPPHRPPDVRVLLVARSAAGLDRSVVARARPAGRFAGSTPIMELWRGLRETASDDVFRDALAGYADLLGAPPAALRAATEGPGPKKASQGPVWLVMARALLAALDARHGEESHSGKSPGEVRYFPVGKVAQGLMRHERDWWTAATEWDWGAADPPTRVLRDQAIAAVTLLGARTEEEAADALCLVPGLAEATASRRRAVASWITALYPAGGGLPLSLASEWFVVRQLTASPSLAGALRSEITAGQEARAVGMLARAAGWVRGAEQLFGAFADGDADRQVHAVAHASMADDRAAARLDGTVAGQLRSPAGVRGGLWAASDPGPGAGELVQLARLDAATAGRLPAVRSAIAARRVARYRALAARSAAYWPGLADALRSSTSPREHRDGITIWLALDADARNFPSGLVPSHDVSGVAEGEASVLRAWHRTARATTWGPDGTYRQRVHEFPAQLHAEGLDEDTLEAAREAVAVERAHLAASAYLRAAPSWGQGVASRELGLALRDLGDALDRLGHHSEAVLATRELVSAWGVVQVGPGDPEIAHLPEALLDLSIRLARAGHGAEASRARAQMLQLARDRLTRQGTGGHLFPAWNLFTPSSAQRPDPAGRVLAELAWDEAAVRGRDLLLPDGRVDLRALLEEFTAFWSEHGELPRADGTYPRVPPDRVLAALLRRAVGAAGSVEVATPSCYPAGRRRHQAARPRVDVVVRTQYTDASNEPAEQRAAIQMHELARERGRRWGRKDPQAEELAALDELLARHQLDSGILVLIRRRAARRGPGPGRSAARHGIPDPRIRQARTPDGRAATIVAC
jgi:hypothetical protein